MSIYPQDHGALACSAILLFFTNYIAVITAVFLITKRSKFVQVFVTSLYFRLMLNFSFNGHAIIYWVVVVVVVVILFYDNLK